MLDLRKCGLYSDRGEFLCFSFRYQVTEDMPAVPQGLLWGFLSWHYPRTVGAARVSLGMRDGWQAQPRPSSLWGLGLPRVAGPPLPQQPRGDTGHPVPAWLKAGTCVWCHKAGEGQEAALGRWLPPEPPPLRGDGGDWCQTDRPWHRVCVHPLGQTTQAAGLRAACGSVLAVARGLLAGPVLVPPRVWDQGWELAWMILLSPFPPPLPHTSTYISSGGQGAGYKFASPRSKLPLIWSWFCQGRSKYGAGTLGIWAIKVRAGEAKTEANFWSKRSDPGILAPSYMYFWLSLRPPPRHPPCTEHKLSSAGGGTTGPGCSQHPEFHEGQVSSRSGQAARVESQLSTYDPVHCAVHRFWSQTSAIHSQSILLLRQAGNFTLLNAK